MRAFDDGRVGQAHGITHSRQAVPPAALSGRDRDLAAKLEQLRTWGNLIPSSRPVKAGNIREYHRVRPRYQRTQGV
jgi:hypothetical protein